MGKVPLELQEHRVLNLRPRAIRCVQRSVPILMGVFSNGTLKGGPLKQAPKRALSASANDAYGGTDRRRFMQTYFAESGRMSG